MFCAFVSICSLLLLLVFCAALSLSDLQRYNFGLYYVLLCGVGIMLSCAFCIANPNMGASFTPAWYARLCKAVEEYRPAPLRHPPSLSQDRGSALARVHRRLQQREQTGMLMLAPALHLMHNVWQGTVAWAREDDEETDGADPFETVSHSHHLSIIREVSESALTSPTNYGTLALQQPPQSLPRQPPQSLPRQPLPRQPLRVSLTPLSILPALFLPLPTYRRLLIPDHVTVNPLVLSSSLGDFPMVDADSVSSS